MTQQDKTKDSIGETLEEFDEELFERLAHIEHERWSKWQQYLHGLCIDTTIEPPESVHMEYEAKCFPKAFYDRWERQIATPYHELSDKEKDNDREQVRGYSDIVKNFLLQAIIKEYKSLVEKEEKNIRIHTDIIEMHDVAPFEWHRGRIAQSEESITSLKQKIINLESKLK